MFRIHRSTSRAQNLLIRRALVALCVAMLWTGSLYTANLVYLAQTWSYFGFGARLWTDWDVFSTILYATLAYVVLPKSFNGVSSVLQHLLYALVYVPTLVITVGAKGRAGSHYEWELLAIFVGFLILGAYRPSYRRSAIGRDLRHGSKLIEVIWLVMAIALLLENWSIMSLVSIDQVYGQRDLGRASTLAWGYTQTYFGNVFSPALICFGFVNRSLRQVLFGCLGALEMYAINAQRTLLFLPIAIIAFAWWQSRRSPRWRSPLILHTSLVAATFTLTFLREHNAIASSLADLIVWRTIATPGLTLAHYADVFSQNGYTFWSHIRWVDTFVSVPPGWLHHSEWPALGRIIGDIAFSNPMHNFNANFVSSDGIAAAGPIGAIMICVALRVWLNFVDRAFSKVDMLTSQLLLLPVGIALTNGSLFTILLSFGGLFWIFFPEISKIAEGMGAFARRALPIRFANRIAISSRES